MNYPLISINSCGEIEIVEDKESFVICGKSAIKNRYYENLTLFDSEYDQFEITSVAFVRYHGAFWGFRLLRDRQVEVTLKFVKVSEAVSLQQILSAVGVAMNKDRHFWSSAGDIDEILLELETKKTIEEMISALAVYVT